MRTLWTRALVCAIGLAMMSPAWAGAGQITVFAAASLADVLNEIAPAHEKQHGDVVRFNFGGSGTLARQIREGARADVFFSADERWVSQLEADGLLVEGSRRAIAGNQLVVIVNAAEPATVREIGDLAGPAVRRVALGEPDIVPAGTYARAWLEGAGLWETVRTRGVFMDNVRAVLAVVESGDVDAGIVYRTDAAISAKVKVAVEAPLDAGPSIVYAAAVVAGVSDEAAARAFVDFLQGEFARTAFACHGFQPAVPR